MNPAFLYDHVRTPRGKGRADGALHATTPVALATQVLQALRERNRLDRFPVDDAGLGIVMPVGEQGADLTRSALLCAGYGDDIAGFQLNRFCTSGLDTVNIGAAQVMAGQAEAFVGGGVESMSRVAIGSDGGACYSDPAVLARYPYIPNGVAADLMATLDGVDREALDAYALQSQQRACAAAADGRFDASLVPVRDDAGRTVLQRDEAPRPSTSAEGLAALKPAFEAAGRAGYDALVQQRYPQLEAIRHGHTSGSSSAIVDGACAVLVGSAGFGARAGLRPRARVLGFASCASEPLLSLAGPVPATRKLLTRLGLTLDDIDLFEINEAFSVVPLRYMRTLGLGADRVNVNGGAIALGHPLGATGAMLLGTALDELERRGLARALVTLCAAEGQSTATVIERLPS